MHPIDIWAKSFFLHKFNNSVKKSVTSASEANITKQNFDLVIFA